MRIRFFAPVQQLPQPVVLPVKKAADEESIRDEAMSESCSSQYSEQDSTSIEDSLSNIDQFAEDDSPLPEMSLDQAASLKRLLLSPLEPEIDF